MTKEEIQKNSEHWYNKYKDAEGKVEDLENQNRLLGERCNQLLNDKGDLTDQIADIKANCDLAIEGRDIKIKELEEQNKWLEGCKLELGEHLGKANDRIANLEKENAELTETLKTYNGCGDWDNDFHTCRVYLQHEELQMYINQLTKATDLLKKMYYLYFDPCVTHKDLENRDKLFEEVKQFILERLKIKKEE